VLADGPDGAVVLAALADPLISTEPTAPPAKLAATIAAATAIFLIGVMDILLVGPPTGPLRERLPATWHPPWRSLSIGCEGSSTTAAAR